MFNCPDTHSPLVAASRTTAPRRKRVLASPVSQSRLRAAPNQATDVDHSHLAPAVNQAKARGRSSRPAAAALKQQQVKLETVEVVLRHTRARCCVCAAVQPSSRRRTQTQAACFREDPPPAVLPGRPRPPCAARRTAHGSHAALGRRDGRGSDGTRRLHPLRGARPQRCVSEDPPDTTQAAGPIMHFPHHFHYRRYCSEAGLTYSCT